VPEHLRGQVDLLRGTCFCVLYDLCCWLTGTGRPVPEETAAYALAEFRDVPNPRQRLAGYCDPALLELWDAALTPFLRAGFRLAPKLGDSAALREEGLQEDAPRSHVELRFTNRSSVIMPGIGRHARPLPVDEWIMDLWVSLDANSGYVHDACVRPLWNPEATRPGPRRTTLAPPPNPFVLLAATPTAGWSEVAEPVYPLAGS
jgi:hypothetical protein